MDAHTQLCFLHEHITTAPPPNVVDRLEPCTEGSWCWGAVLRAHRTQSALRETSRIIGIWLRLRDNPKIKSNVSAITSRTQVEVEELGQKPSMQSVSFCQPPSKSGPFLAATRRRKRLFWSSSDSRQHTSRVQKKINSKERNKSAPGGCDLGSTEHMERSCPSSLSPFSAALTPSKGGRGRPEAD